LQSVLFNDITDREKGEEVASHTDNYKLSKDAAGDYIAGMTDRYLLREHARLFNRA
jgi:dGTP triphosphohydrolase